MTTPLLGYDLVVSGKIVCGEELSVIDGYIAVKDGVIQEIGTEDVDSDITGIVIPAFINAHTHVGDAIAKEIICEHADKSLEEVVGPRGIKHQLLEGTDPWKIEASMNKAIQDMIWTGTMCFADFREGGLTGVNMLIEATMDKPIDALILGRPLGDPRGVDGVLTRADGIGLSSTSDYTLEYLGQVVSAVKKSGKMFAIHACERNRDDIEVALALEPDFLVHMTHASGADLKKVADMDIPIVICPRSNMVTGAAEIWTGGMKPPVKNMLEHGITVALGTDNLMFNSSDMFSELEFLSKIYSISSHDALKMATVNGAITMGGKVETGFLAPGLKARMLILDYKSSNIYGIENVIDGVVRRARPDDIKATIYGENAIIRR